MFFRQFLHEEKSCLSYMVGCPSMGVCAVVDAQGDPNKYVDIASNYGLTIIAVIETHVQADHVSSSQDLARITGATLYFGPGAQVNHEFTELTDGQILKIGRRDIRVIHTPGHTAEHICLQVDDWLVITGDTLFVGDVGRVDLVDQASDDAIKLKAKDLYSSVEKILLLPDITEVYPGHYRGSSCGKGIDSKPSSTIGRERQKNQALQLNEQAFVDYLLEDMPPPPPNFLEIKRENSGK